MDLYSRRCRAVLKHRLQRRGVSFKWGVGPRVRSVGAPPSSAGSTGEWGGNGGIRSMRVIQEAKVSSSPLYAPEGSATFRKPCLCATLVSNHSGLGLIRSADSKGQEVAEQTK